MSLTSASPARIGRELYPAHFQHSPIAGPERFSEEDAGRFRHEGFITIEQLLAPDGVADAQQAVSDLIAGRITEYKGLEYEKGIDVSAIDGAEREPYVRKLWSFVAHCQRLNELAHLPRLLEILEGLIGSPVRLIQDMALLKPPHIGGEKPWHQDNAYFLMEPLEKVVGVWIALDRATIENGCMHVIPGSHRAGPRPHYHDRDCQLPDDAVEVSQDTTVPLDPGGALIFSSLLHHGTPPNTSADRRRALQFHYASIHCTRMSDARHQELFRDPAHPDKYTGCATFQNGVPGTKISER
jgi:phytanoyl-CoA hydroxylase